MSVARSLRLPEVGMGTAPLGGMFTAVEERDAIATVGEALATGLQLFDTAPLYGHGAAERRLGRALRDAGGVDVTISTKVGRLLVEGAPPDPSQSGVWPGVDDVGVVFDFSRAGVLASLEASLARLGRDAVDIVFVHDPDDHFQQALDEAVPTLVELRDEGVVRAIGVGMNQAEMLTDFVERADLDVVLIAGRYTLLDQTALDGLLPACALTGTRVVVGGAFNSGILAGSPEGRTYDYADAPAEIVQRVTAIDHVCRRHGVALRAAALQFPLAHPGVSTLLLGPRSVSELRDSLGMLAAPIPAELWEDLRALQLLRADAPTPSGPVLLPTGAV